jgi:hypothetical protein
MLYMREWILSPPVTFFTSSRTGSEDRRSDTEGLTSSVIPPILRIGPASRRRGKGIVFRMWRLFPQPL